MNGFFIAIAALCIIVLGAFLIFARAPESPAVPGETAATSSPSEEHPANHGATPSSTGRIPKDDGVMYDGEILAGNRSPLISFNTADYEAVSKSGKLVVLYFYANWCPVCKAEFPKMQSAFNNLGTSAVVGFRVNFDDNETDADEVALARKFGVTYQHTKVFLKNGTRPDRFLDSWDETRYMSEINKRI